MSHRRPSASSDSRHSCPRAMVGSGTVLRGAAVTNNQRGKDSLNKRKKNITTDRIQDSGKWENFPVTPHEYGGKYCTYVKQTWPFEGQDGVKLWVVRSMSTSGRPH